MSQTLTEEWRKRAALLASPLGHSNGNVTGGGGICLYLSTQWQKEENSGSLRPVCLHSTYTGQTKLHKETLSHENCKRTANLQVRIYYYCLYSSVRGEPILPLSFMVFDCKIWGKRVLAEYLSVFTIDMYTEDMMGLDYSVLHQPYIPQLRKRLALPRPRTNLGAIICLLMRRWVQVVWPLEHSEVIGAANTVVAKVCHTSVKY